MHVRETGGWQARIVAESIDRQQASIGQQYLNDTVHDEGID